MTQNVLAIVTAFAMSVSLLPGASTAHAILMPTDSYQRIHQIRNMDTAAPGATPREELKAASQSASDVIAELVQGGMSIQEAREAAETPTITPIDKTS